MDIKNPILQKIYNLDGSAESLRGTYKEWARNYDKDTLDGMGYVAPGIAAQELARRVEPADAILDVGCGTGLVGAELAALDYPNLHGIDLSREMLEVADKKNVYRSLGEADITKSLPFDDNQFDAAISVGVFTSGHVGPEALDDLARVTKAGGPIVVTVHEKVWERDGYQRHLDAIQELGLVSIETIAESPYHQKEGMTCQLCVMRAS